MEPAPTRSTPPTPRPAYRGEVVYLFAFDLAYDMKREPVRQILGRPVREYSILPSKRSPRRLFFYRPGMVELPPQRRVGPGGPVDVRWSLKLFGVGALSIQVRVPFQVPHLEDLVDYHDLAFADGPLPEEVLALAGKARQDLLPYCIRPVDPLEEDEAYTVFCLEALPPGPDGRPALAMEWLKSHRRPLAGLLLQELDPAELSDQEAGESTSQYLSYYRSDLAVVDWDAALVAGAGGSLDEVLHIMELANVQLVELAAYDRLLDGVLERSYRDVARRGLATRADVHRNLREIRLDLARLSDELGNITKFFGDWYLAKIYEQLSARFHLDQWRDVIDEKLNTVGDLHELLQQDRTNRWMVILETTIVLLFILDVLLLLLYSPAGK